MNTKEKLRKVFKFLTHKTIGHDEYGNNGYVLLSGKKFFVGAMSYDEYYLEPYYKGRTERDGSTKNTLWENIDTIEIIDLFVANGYLKIEVL